MAYSSNDVWHIEHGWNSTQVTPIAIYICKAMDSVPYYMIILTDL